MNYFQLPILSQQGLNVLSDIPVLDRKIKIGMVQINNSFSRQNYLPLSVGFLYSFAKSHARNFDNYTFINPIYKRMPVSEAVKHLSGADIVCFSSYVWNFNISCEIAKSLKKINQNTLIVFGGCHIPDTIEKGLEKFIRKYKFIDIAIRGEGEIPFTALLENYPTKTWHNVPSATFLENDALVITKESPRVENLNDIPSPYLDGYFDDVVLNNPEEKWIGLFETNRGCPFSCSFCDWGVGSKNRMANYDNDRLYKEIDWFSKNKVQFVYCCDANFGMYKRDLDIAKYFAKVKSETGYPERFSVQNTKNSTDLSYGIQKVLFSSGLDKGVLLAFQSLHQPSLSAIKRQNIKLDVFFDLQKRFQSEGIPTFSDIILGLPLETYETFTDGVSTLIQHGQHNRMQFNNLSILPNAPIVDDMSKYGIQTVESKILNMHGSLDETEEVPETQVMVIATDHMCKTDWVKARSFGYMTALLHFDKLLQLPNIILNTIYGVQFKDIINKFMSINDNINFPIITYVNEFFKKQSESLQNGGSEFVKSEKWLNIWWPADELMLIHLFADGKSDLFYEESARIFQMLGMHDDLINDAINLNKLLIKQPFQTENINYRTMYNIWDIYRNGLLSIKTDLKEQKDVISIDRSCAWDSWEEWCEKVVWYGNKKADYIYKADVINV